MIDVLKQDRGLIAHAIGSLSNDQLSMVPGGHSNNILWNLGHIVVVQQQLHYLLSGIDMYVAEDFVAQFARDTSPADWATLPDIDAVKSLLVELPGRLEEDYAAGRFDNYKEYTTANGIVLATLEDAFAFNHFHEGVHTGIILSLRKRIE